MQGHRSGPHDGRAPLPHGAAGDSDSALEDAALALRALRPASVDPWASSEGAFRPSPGVGLVDDLAAMPEVGALFLGFRLIAELGRGTFGRVYLGRQGDLADRLVALKVSTESRAESQRLAQLQHTHIVPVHSLHKAGPLYAVCMPYFGATTLADVLQDLGRRDALPASGKGLVSTVENCKSRTLASLSSANLAPAPAPARPAGGEASQALRRLEGLTYVEAVLWLGSCLADGLAHAHERGIVHRDLKPANVLLTDDGQPMLLDFNLADDQKEARARASHVGGTLPYMAPEHLAAFDGLDDPLRPGARPSVDARSDVYSLGVLLFELLTGRPPFARQPVLPEEPVANMIRARLRPPPRLRPHNPAVSPAAEAIVRRCLDPDPARRYPTARQLREDLDRQLNHLPLLHTPEPSWAERLRKWSLRHPRLASMSTAAVASGVLVVTLLAALFARSQRLARLEAESRWSGFRDDLRSARLLLAARPDDAAQRDEGRAVACRGLARFGALNDPEWRSRPLPLHLPDEERVRLNAEAGELMLLLATVCEPPDAARLVSLAAGCFAEGEAPLALWRQKADVMSRLGRRDEGLERKAAEARPRGTWDRYLVAVDLARAGKYPEAAGELRAVLADDPQHFAAWFLLGNCRLDLGDERDAVAHYTACLALRPRFHGAWFNRGLASLRLGRHADADADFTRAAELRPSHAASLVHRALAREALGKHREAVADLDEALERGASPTRVLIARSRLKQALGDAAGAERDRKRAVEEEPRDEEGYVARGVAKARDDVGGALADFAEAVRLNPRSLAGWQNQAHVLSERLGRTAEAVSALGRILTLHPEQVQTRASRAVLLARLGRRDEALADARAALARAGSSAEVRFQAAGAFALCSEKQPGDRDEAVALLAQALKGGFGHDLIDRDPDLAPLRGDPRFEALVKAAQTVRSEATR